MYINRCVWVTEALSLLQKRAIELNEQLHTKYSELEAQVTYLGREKQKLVDDLLASKKLVSEQACRCVYIHACIGACVYIILYISVQFHCPGAKVTNGHVACTCKPYLESGMIVNQIG